MARLLFSHLVRFISFVLTLDQDEQSFRHSETIYANTFLVFNVACTCLRELYRQLKTEESAVTCYLCFPSSVLFCMKISVAK
jgi:hypothetical protein